MAGAKSGLFIQKYSPFLQHKLDEARSAPNVNQSVLRMLELQYRKDPREDDISEHERQRHYESEMHITFEGQPIKGIERLYRRSMVIEPTTVCAAHCRWCLRGQYDMLHLTREEITRITRYIGKAEVTQDLREVLITGGDPLMVPDKRLVPGDAWSKVLPESKIIRIGTRVPLQDPVRINDSMLNMLTEQLRRFRIEIGIHINHPSELFPEVIAAIDRLIAIGVGIYDQTVLLKGVNDELTTLIDLYDILRYKKIEAHYLFHCIPLRGMKHHRTSIQRGIELINALTSSGHVSGRSKPMFTLLTDVGKVTLYENTIIDRDDAHNVLLQTDYRYEDRVKWNPLWQLPKSASVDDNGFLRVWYLDVVENT